jgi:hypothetical protein
MISTKDTRPAGISKFLLPGNRIIKINNIYFDRKPWDSKLTGTAAYDIKLDCEGPDLGEDFEGLFIDKNNESLGRHKGQIGTIRASSYVFEDKELSTGDRIDRDATVVRFLKNLCEALNITEWIDAQDNKHETIEDLMLAFNEEKPFKDKFLSTCIAGKEYTNKSGYINYDLFFPKFTKGGVPFESEDVETGLSRVYPYDESKYIIKEKVKEVSSFKAKQEASSEGGSNWELG